MLIQNIDYANSPILLGGGDGLKVEAAVSDLFFNYEHPAWDKARKGEPSNLADFLGLPVTETELAGLREDVKDFTGTLSILLGGVEVDHEALIEDFLKRL